MIDWGIGKEEERLADTVKEGEVLQCWLGLPRLECCIFLVFSSRGCRLTRCSLDEQVQEP